MPEKILYLTNRYASPYFVEGIRSSFDPLGVELVMKPIDESIDDASSYIGVITEGLECKVDLKDATLMPFNETQAPVGATWSKRKSGAIKYFIVTSNTYRSVLSERDIEPSFIASSPLIKLPRPLHDREDLSPLKPLKFFVPAYHGWSASDIEALVLLLANAMSRDINDMSLVEFVVETPPFEYKTIAGETVSFTNIDGSHMWKLIDSQVVCCIGNMFNMEMTFLRSLRSMYRIPIADFYECLINRGFDSQAILSTLVQNKPYSEVKRDLVTKDWFYQWAKGNRPMFDYTSGTRGTSTIGSMELSVDELIDLLKPRAIIDRMDTEILLKQQVENKKIFDGKISSLVGLIRRLGS